MASQHLLADAGLTHLELRLSLLNGGLLDTTLKELAI
jgi:hypothetical protein